MAMASSFEAANKVRRNEADVSAVRIPLAILTGCRHPGPGAELANVRWEHLIDARILAMPGGKLEAMTGVGLRSCRSIPMCSRSRYV